MSAQAISDALWAILGMAVVAMIAASYLPRARLVRLSVLVRRAESKAPLYVLVMLAWMWLGWHFFAR